MWLTLESKGADYLTVLVSADGYGGVTAPAVVWPDGCVQEGDVREILERVEQEFPFPGAGPCPLVSDTEMNTSAIVADQTLVPPNFGMRR